MVARADVESANPVPIAAQQPYGPSAKMPA